MALSNHTHPWSALNNSACFFFFFTWWFDQMVLQQVIYILYLYFSHILPYIYIPHTSISSLRSSPLVFFFQMPVLPSKKPRRLWCWADSLSRRSFSWFWWLWLWLWLHRSIQSDTILMTQLYSTWCFFAWIHNSNYVDEYRYGPTQMLRYGYINSCLPSFSNQLFIWGSPFPC